MLNLNWDAMMGQEILFGGNSMVAALRRVLICSPESAGWSDEPRAGRWKGLGYFHLPDFELATSQHRQLKACLEGAGAEVVQLTGAHDLSLDAVYAHDASLMTEWGAICMRMGKPSRRGESAHHAAFFKSQDIPVLGTVQAPGTAEGGDLVWLDDKTLLAGRSYRTNRSGIDQLAQMLAPYGVEVIAAPLPHLQGAAHCLHLMSLLSLLDARTALVDQPWLAVETVELLVRRGFRLIQIEESERPSMACNVLSLDGRRLLALQENRLTNRRLRQSGFEVFTFEGSEISQNGSGGPTCLTRPIFRRRREDGGSRQEEASRGFRQSETIVCR